MRSRFHKPLSLFLCSLVLYISFHVYLPFPNTQSPAIAESVPQLDSNRLLQEGIKLYETANYEAALKILNQALMLYRQRKDKQGEAQTLVVIGSVYVETTTDNKAAEDSLQKALKLAKEIRDVQLEGWALMTLGRLAINTGQDQKAQELGNRSLGIARSTQDNRLEAWSLVVLSGVYQYAPNGVDQANALNQQAISLAQQVGDKRLEGRIHWRTGSMLQNQEKYADAIAAYQKALPISQGVNDRRNLAILLLNLGQSHNKLKQYDKAIQALEMCLSLSETLAIPFFKFEAPFALGVVYGDATNPPSEKALQFYQSALKVAEQYNNLQQQQDAWTNIEPI